MTARLVTWGPSAAADYYATLEFLTDRSPVAARKFADTVHETIAGLARRNTGRPGRVSGSFEKSIKRYSYVIAYMYDGEALHILRIIHTARDWPRGGWPKE
ncbi:MAG TPA: type II toxin-antitoxin system RelE/ParE family toxin [Caulobacterales bacterium]|jgi:plasmid stabilization system protein ParE|nr:type II toxin-antitoxin system RelE/ParE family toxin [Caulobacterales bacterium]